MIFVLKKFFSISNRTIVVLLLMCAVHGCSGSSESPAYPSDNNENNPTTDTTGENLADSPGDPADSSVPMLDTVPVSFDITVPAYTSNELLVRLTWGTVVTSASWVRDETWFVAADFPVNAENLLVITFTDRNGELELATYEQMLSTTTRRNDNYLIQADQFDIDRWDADGDGTSNLSELLDGNDPLVNESESLVIQDELNNIGSRMVSNLGTYSGIHEAYIPDERPFFDDTSIVVSLGTVLGEELFDTTNLTINIDEDGNGTLAKFEHFDESPAYFESITQEGIRTNTGTSIQWISSHERFRVELSCRINKQLTSETRRLNDGAISQEGFQMHSNNCINNMVNNHEITYSLTGVIVDDSPNCEATAGSITLDARGIWTYPVYPVRTWEYSKEVEDIYWTVNGLDYQGQLVEEFLAPIDLAFYCDFPDL